jgi:MarR family transcriptional regulator, organic hydroperoxide resistance regulator
MAGQTKRTAPPQHALTVTKEDLLEDGSDEKFRKMLHDLLAVSARIEAVRAGFAKMIGLTGIEYTMMIAIMHLAEKEPVYVNSLAEHLHLSGAFVTIQTNKLVKKGLLKKIKNKQDARRVELQETKKARDLLTKLAPAQCQVNDVVFQQFNKRDLDRMSGLVEKMLANAGKGLSLIDYLSQDSSFAG